MATLEPRTTPAADDRSTTRFAQDLWHDIERFDLADHVAELETKGLTVVPPGKAAPPELIERLRQACFRVARKRHGRGYDPDANAKAGFYGWTEQGGDGTRIVRDGPRSSYE